MTTRTTAAHARIEYILAMGDELGAVYNELWQEVARLHQKWSEYVVLFGTSESRVNLLNDAAPRFTRMVQVTLWDDVLLHIARLTDPPETGRGAKARQNLTVKRLPLLIAHEQTRKDIGYTIEELDKACEFARDWRNRKISHGDFDLAMGQAAEPLKPASRLHVKAALAGLTSTLNCVSMHYLDGNTTIFDWGPTVGGAMDLLHVLDSGLAADRAKDERIKSGQGTADDFRLRDL